MTFKSLMLMPILPMIGQIGTVYYIEKAGYHNLSHAAMFFISILILTAIYLKEE